MRHRDSKGHYIKEDYARSCYACGREKSSAWLFNHGTELMLCHNCYVCILRNPNRGVKMYAVDERVCYSCGGHNEKKNGGIDKNWFSNKPTRFLLCHRCYNDVCRKDYKAPPPKPRNLTINRAKKFTFKKKIILKHEVRVGVCNWCRRVMGIDCRRTAMHHDGDRYDKNNPLRYTIEICDICHGSETWDLRQMSKLIPSITVNPRE